MIFKLSTNRLQVFCLKDQYLWSLQRCGDQDLDILKNMPANICLQSLWYMWRPDVSTHICWITRVPHTVNHCKERPCVHSIVRASTIVNFRYATRSVSCKRNTETVHWVSFRACTISDYPRATHWAHILMSNGRDCHFTAQLKNTQYVHVWLIIEACCAFSTLYQIISTAYATLFRCQIHKLLLVTFLRLFDAMIIYIGRYLFGMF